MNIFYVLVERGTSAVTSFAKKALVNFLVYPPHVKRDIADSFSPEPALLAQNLQVLSLLVVPPAPHAMIEKTPLVPRYILALGLWALESIEVDSLNVRVKSSENWTRILAKDAVVADSRHD